MCKIIEKNRLFYIEDLQNGYDINIYLKKQSR